MTFSYEGREIPVDGEQTIAAALIAAGEPPHYFCGIGACFRCLVTVNGTRAQRACMVTAQSGDRVSRDAV
ncbi:2Fe-2S iron-sulfur cluster-binding protein [Allorhizocola rhizosphaerae]|uniref:2Fe-2S iron-sulfur cluster-binding protein n=1 Tax=Allorhizocola rhizosphaerae TaxID=1872709 RepID=UPI000E3ED6FF|nr:2Fe-2S iron-sulfur cluster-binding protein [Allorhizocola rhizosphaerae]